MQAASKQVPLMKVFDISKEAVWLQVLPDGFLFGIAEIACGEAFKLFTGL